MIYTITFSPSIDYVINSLEPFKATALNRIEDYQFLPGGKGINASIVLNRLGYSTQALTFLGGPTKQLFLDLIAPERVQLVDFGATNATRINLKMTTPTSSFEINGPKAVIAPAAAAALLDFVRTNLRSTDLVLIMGICQEAFLTQLVAVLSQHQIPFALDVDAPVVRQLLSAQPLILKPNRTELAALMQRELNSQAALEQAMRELKTHGAQMVLVSDGARGSYFLDANGDFYQVQLEQSFAVVSAVGAGDTLLASFIAIYRHHRNAIQALRQATSLSIATTQTQFLATQADLDRYAAAIKITKL